MSASYPATIVTTATFAPVSDNITPVMAGQINPIYSEVIAIEQTLGALPKDYAPSSSAYISSTNTFSTVSARIGNLEKGLATRSVDTIGGSTIQPVAANSTAVPLIIKQYESSTSNLLEFRISDGTLKTAINSAGNVIAIDGGTA
jgi:hypothetical protein